MSEKMSSESNPSKAGKALARWLGRDGQPDTSVQAILGNPQAQASADADGPVRWIKRVGWLAVVLAVLWALFAPLTQGVPVNGFLKVEGNSKTIQHLKGGTVSNILVKEGQRVKTGEPLLQLDDVQLKAQLGVVEAQLVSALAVEARLMAERFNLPQVTYPDFLLKRAQPDAKAAMDLQNQLFASRRNALQIEVAGTQEAVAGFEEQIRGFTAQEKAKAEQLRLFKEEYNNLKPLHEQGFVPRNRMFELERAMAMLSGQRSEDLANVGRARSQIAESRQRMLLTQENYRKEVETQLTDAQKQADDLKQRHVAILDDLSRVTLSSPVEGTVVGLAVHTVGGVISPGQRVMDIVPTGLPLVVEVQIPTHLIDSVQPGLEADVHFLALDRTLVPVVVGDLSYVSADRQADPNRPEITYFIGRVSLKPEEMAKLGKHQLQSGMPAEVVIKTGERTFVGYLLKPLLSRLTFAFKER